ncbi:MAG: hypothetical protein ACM3S1_16955 [Hyphomicrobiales bacterium]
MKFAGKTQLIALGVAGLLGVSVLGSVMALEGHDADAGSPAAGQGVENGRHHPIRATVQQIIDASGLDQQVFIDGYKDGKTINQILAENGVDSAAVQAEVLANIKSKLDQAVADGKLTQERADELYQRATEGLPKLMDHTPPEHPRLHRWVLRQGRQGLTKSAAESIGIEVRELVSELRDGKSIADVATEHGVDVAQVEADMTADANAWVDQAVANGHLDPDRAAEIKERLPERIDRFVNRTHRDVPDATTTPAP